MTMSDNLVYIELLNDIISSPDDITKIILAYSHPYFDTELYELFVPMYVAICNFNKSSCYDINNKFNNFSNCASIQKYIRDIWLLHHENNDENNETYYMDPSIAINFVGKIEELSIIRSKSLILVINNMYKNTDTDTDTDIDTSYNILINIDSFITFKHIRNNIFDIFKSIENYLRIEFNNEFSGVSLTFIDLTYNQFGIPILTHEWRFN